MSMHYLYILYSESSDIYYVGQTDDIDLRLKHHNFSDQLTFTSKHRPWELKTLFTVESRSVAMTLEKFIKKQKSRKFIERLVDKDFIPDGKLSQLIRVPHVRD